MLSVQDDGTARLRGMLPGTYRLCSFPDRFLFTPATAAVGPEGGTIELRWTRR